MGCLKLVLIGPVYTCQQIMTRMADAATLRDMVQSKSVELRTPGTEGFKRT